MVRFITPIREKAVAIHSDEDYLRRVMKLGADKARSSALETMTMVRSAMGLNYY
jgi:tryptophanyl-tRNA synthetase